MGPNDCGFVPFLPKYQAAGHFHVGRVSRFLDRWVPCISLCFSNWKPKGIFGLLHLRKTPVNSGPLHDLQLFLISELLMYDDHWFARTAKNAKSKQVMWYVWLFESSGLELFYLFMVDKPADCWSVRFSTRLYGLAPSWNERNWGTMWQLHCGSG